ncbi:MAG: hypothetical protein HDR04_07685 [Lachnospiraceae bacterium]|nr:hypothetical protein [Lachnospiraceae bacterium]
MSREIDVRIMKLNKWYVPKSFAMDDLDHDQPVVLGYFDALQVQKVEIDRTQRHPFTSGYEELERSKNEEKKKLVDYSSQEQMLFLNICESEEEENGLRFTRDSVERFWQDKTCPYIFLSMIHINHGGKLKRALRKIAKVFEKDYLSYISFDYCDIVLFTHNMQIRVFMEKIKQLFEVKGTEEAVIFDTFSMVSFWPEFAANAECCSGGCLCEQEGKSDFQATINLSIRDYNQFTRWYSKIDQKGIRLTRYNMFGRHDISIVNDEANTSWLMQVMGRLHDAKSQEIFWTFETYIKILDDSNVTMTPDEPDYLSEVYSHVTGTLDEAIRGSKGIEEIIMNSEFRDKSRYLLPIYEVRDCICSIVKNSFAEEFIYCIYESFLHFISYMKKEIKYLSELDIDPIISEGEIANAYDDYFTALNTLVNSTMHNERQFVQATAFNAVFYSVPPKIMAFYNAYIYRIKQILRDTECTEEYTFLIYPSFSPTIFVRRISLADNPPVDRILTVRISEKSLYDIESVVYQMVHELAHYVGKELRCRNVRKKKILAALIGHIAVKCAMDRKTCQLLNSIVETKLMKDDTDNTAGLCSSESEYLEDMNDVGRELLQLLDNSQECRSFFERYYREQIDIDENFCDELLEDIGINEKNQAVIIRNLLPRYCDVKYAAFHDQLKKMNSYEEMCEYEDYIEMLKSVYSECYADLQMILVLAMSAEDYLYTFFVKQQVPVESMLLDIESMLRISTVYRVMTDCSVWQKSANGPDCELAAIIEYINEYNKDVREGTGTESRRKSEEYIEQIKAMQKQYDFKKGIRLKKSSTEQMQQIRVGMEEIVPYVDAAVGLYEYLLEVMMESLKEYTCASKKVMIEEVRKIVGKILNFDDAAGVFDSIEKELSYYKQEGCKIQPGRTETL